MKQKHTNSFRKILVGLCMLCMVCMTCYGTMFVHAEGDVKLTASTSKAERGKTVSITLDLEGNPGLWGIKFKVGYDHSALKLTSVANGTIFSEEDVVLPDSLDKEKYVFLASAGQLENIRDDGQIVTLNFEVAEDAAIQDYPVTLEITQAINVDGEEIGIEAINGSVMVRTAEVVEPVEPEKNQIVQSPDNQQAGGAETGDNSHTMLWIAVTCFSGAVLLVLGIYIKKKRWIKA